MKVPIYKNKMTEPKLNDHSFISASTEHSQHSEAVRSCLIKGCFIFEGLQTEVSLYQDGIIFTNLQLMSSMKFTSQMSFKSIENQETTVGFVIQASNQYQFSRCSQSDDLSDWVRNLSVLLTRTGFHDYFNLHKKIGCGAFGKVYLATELSTGKLVAVKMFIKPDETDLMENPESIDVSKMAISEVSLMRKLSHQNIVKFLGHYETSFAHYIVMQHIKGQPLSKIISERKLSAIEKKNWLFQLLSAVESLQECRVIHKDIKPHNILIQEESNRLVLIDFGLAVTLSKGQAQVHSPSYSGTLGYIAPELLSDQKFTTSSLFKSDLYSVGAVFFEMIFNRDLHDRKSSHDLFESNKKAKSCSLLQLLGVEAGQKELLENLLKKQPQKRISCNVALEHWYFSGSRQLYEKVKLQEINSQPYSLLQRLKLRFLQ